MIQKLGIGGNLIGSFNHVGDAIAEALGENVTLTVSLFFRLVRRYLI